MPLDLLSLPDDVLLMIMSYGDNSSLLALRAANSRFNGLLLTYPRQICDQIITAHFCDPFIAHFFQEPTDWEIRYWGLRSRFDGFPYHIRQLRRFPAICEYSEAVDDIMRVLSTRTSIRGQHFSIRGRRRPGSNTRRWVLIYFAMLYHHNTIDLSFLQLHRFWPANVPAIYSPAWEEAVDWVERVLMAKIWKTVSAEMSASVWNSPSEMFPLLRTFVRHTHPAELEAVMNSCYAIERTGIYDRTLLTTFRAKMLPYGDVCETWTRLYKGTIHDKNIV
ncbi:hypothetical protein TWF696_007612 [Orbilia brochopaga]|uniref:F-box domain-containing protein n=1 Tax=Orbilia brochopaga TaxID=3140254 RepID=A0AAV9UP45_9PEZI